MGDLMMPKYIKATDIQPGDIVAFSIKTEHDKYSKVKFMYVEETMEDEFESGDAAVSCRGCIYMQPENNHTDVQLSTIKRQKLHIKDVPTILLLKRYGNEHDGDISGLVPLYAK